MSFAFVRVLGVGGICHLLILPGTASALTTIDSVHDDAYGANIGWINARGDIANGLVVGEAFCSGYMYGANVGWIDMGDGMPDDGLAYSNSASNDYGVNVGANGALRGFAYGANIGWVKFESMGNPVVDLLTGDLDGFAYGANVGWISLGDIMGHVQTDRLDPGPDQDGDMLPDAWELSHSGLLSVLRMDGDGDGDGATDKEEYLAGTDPLDADSLFVITDKVLDPSMSEGHVTWNSVPTRLYRVELNPDPTNPYGWVDSGLANQAPDAGTQTTRTVPIGGSDLENYRVNAIRPLVP